MPYFICQNPNCTKRNLSFYSRNKVMYCLGCDYFLTAQQQTYPIGLGSMQPPSGMIKLINQSGFIPISSNPISNTANNASSTFQSLISNTTPGYTCSICHAYFVSAELGQQHKLTCHR